LQRRSESMSGYPGLWDQAVGGHVDPGESYEDAAAREMKEELGIESPITEIALSFETDYVFNGVFRAVVSSDTEFNFDTNEVAEIKWIAIKDFETVAKNNPDNYPPGFLKVWSVFRDKLITQ
jgi:isopentenyl-diphosphate delta-isomerase